MANVPQSKNDRGARWDNTQDTIARLAADDGVSQWEVQASNLYGWDSVNSVWRRVKVDATGTLVGGGSGGGGAVTVADGADVAQGTTTDVAWVSGAGTVISLLKKIASAGGSAVSVADGADVAQGTTTDLSSANTVIGLLKNIKAALAGTLTVATHAVTLVSTTITGTVDVSDRAGRLLGIVDKGKVWDGTNTATVKAASTAAAAIDPALVVAISPNNTVPVSLTSTTLTGTVDVSDRAARLLGVVDKGKIWDGTNTATVKAGVVAVAGDNPLVVTLHPSSAPTAAQPVTLTSTTVTNTLTTELSTGLTTFNNNALAATKTAVKAGAGKVYGWMIHNPSAATTYIQVWNVAIASITVGTTAPTWVIPIPAGASANVFTDRGVTHSTEINIAATTTATGLTAPATAAVVSIFYI